MDRLPPRQNHGWETLHLWAPLCSRTLCRLWLLGQAREPIQIGRPRAAAARGARCAERVEAHAQCHLARPQVVIAG
jgi:hypothetical protein